MIKEELLKLNAVPEGKSAWLSYDHHLELKRLFDALTASSQKGAAQTSKGLALARLHHFLSDVAKLTLAEDKADLEAAIQFNAFVLIRRGYKVEDITKSEYLALAQLMDGIEQPDPDDMTLHETGSHHAVYEFLVRKLGLSVQPGRGPAWHRAKRLLEAFEAKQVKPQAVSAEIG
jgi:hypothetical protein